MIVNRRRLLLGAAAAVSVRRLVGAPSSEQDDVERLNLALGLEHEAIYAYGLAGRSGLLSARAAEVGLAFQGSHEGHRDLLVGIIRKKGGRPIAPSQSYSWSVPLADEKDALQLAFNLEVGAARAYLSVVPKFSDRSLSEGAAKILSDEVLHATVLRSVLGRDVVPSFRLIEY
jgi:rubrerythrin